MAQFDSEYPDQMEKIMLITKPSAGYELIDSGGEEKLERFGEVILERPDPQALWKKGREEEWQKAAGRFERDGRDGKWVGKLPNEWQIEFGGLTFLIKPTSFKHTGLFPEQLSNWEWVGDILRKNILLRRDEHDPNSSENTFPPNVLNVFGYTGGASLASAKAGAKVTH